VKIIGFVVSLVLFVLGIYIMGNAFYVEGAEFPVFIGGILVTSLGLFIPVHILKRIDG
jgi:cytochrome c biogenesis protein CcdA